MLNPYFRDQMIAASLKPAHHLRSTVAVSHFRDQMIAASLKHADPHVIGGLASLFPRSDDRGLIEALRTCLQPTSRHKAFPRSDDRGLIEAFTRSARAARAARFPRSDDRGLIEAVTLGNGAKLGDYFRDQMIAASLKPWAYHSQGISRYHFRDQMIAASLKQSQRECVARCAGEFPRSDDRGLIEASTLLLFHHNGLTQISAIR